MAIDRIFLVGLMGAGKSTIGKQLAKVLHKEFVDSDREIEAQTGATIPLIFELEGEEGFRRRECEMIDRLTRQADTVLATGGGAILNEENRKVLRERGLVVYLHATVDQLLERTRMDRNRPLLQTEDPRARLEELLEARDPLYRDVADITVDTGKSSIRDVVQQLVQQFEAL
ncbi:MAG: shikimate kinase AroK [Gammaproteobacteria bacterium]|nr:shikimate kinase AroK [Gammaproteobacteria bacterium]